MVSRILELSVVLSVVAGAATYLYYRFFVAKSACEQCPVPKNGSYKRSAS